MSPTAAKFDLRGGIYRDFICKHFRPVQCVTTLLLMTVDYQNLQTAFFM